MKIRVNFRVTGMYFGRNSAFDNDAVILEVKEKPNVLELLQAAKESVSNGNHPNVELFDFKGNSNINSIKVKYTNNINSKRKAGTYEMIDEVVGNRSLVFQYYIYDENFRQLNNNNATAFFNQKPDAEIKDKYSVVIRQVVILNNSEEALKKSV